MLDQNTDRMWFVIGAVIVGAAIIFIANGTLPTLFASVSDSFEETSSKGLEVIENIEPYAGDRRVHFEGIDFLFSKESGTWQYTSKSLLVNGSNFIGLAYPAGDSTGVAIEKPFVKPNTQYVLTLNAHRYGPWGEIDYEVYVGDARVGVFKGGQVDKTYSITMTSPSNLSKNNEIRIESTYPQSNAVWLSNVSITEK